MRKLGIYSMYDNESKIFDTPFICHDDTNAQRKFIMAIQDTNTIVSQFSDNFEIVKIGLFDVEIGEIEPMHQTIIKGNQVLKENKE